MATTVTGAIQYSSTFTKALAGVPFGGQSAPVLPISMGGKFQLANGVSADQCDLEYSATLAFTASTPQVLNLKSLLDEFGATLVFVRIKSIEIIMRGLVDGVTLTLGYATTTANAWTSLVSNPGTITLQAAPTASNIAAFVIAAPGATGWVVGTSNRLLQLDPGSAAFSVDIRIVGCSA